MLRFWLLFALCLMLALCPRALGAQAPSPQPQRVLVSDAPHQCEDCDAWNAPREPFRVFGNTYYVGTEGLSSILITSDQGLILLDGGLPQSAARIDASIRKLGFDTADIRLILNSHAHYDHAGGIPALQRVSGAKVAASREGAAAIENGGPLRDDPQSAFGASGRFPKAKRVQVVRDGEVLRVGDAAVTAHSTPGHTPGGTTWTWRACEGERCLDLVFADSLNPVSAPGFRFGGTPGGPPGAEATLRRSIARVAALPCDILLTVHPENSALANASAADNPGSLVDPQACRAYADRMIQRLEKRLEEERTGGAEEARTGGAAIGVRNAHAMVYDEARERVVLHGGADASAVRGETWERDAGRWSFVSSGGPGPRTFAAMAYDSRRKRVVLFGGNRVLFGKSDDENIFLGDTWEWDGRTWTRITETGPAARAEAAMAFDSRRGRIVLFGGHRGTGENRRRFGDTWEWDGRRWAKAPLTGPQPSARNGAAAAYDGGRGRVVLFGGSTADGVSGETWEWDGMTWREIRSAQTEGRFNAVMAYAPAWNRIVRFGGRFSGKTFGDTWLYDGTSWKSGPGAAGGGDRDAGVAPSARNHAAMAYDAARRRVVLFGGHHLGPDGPADVFGDTWEWDGATWTEAESAQTLKRIDNGH